MSFDEIVYIIHCCGITSDAEITLDSQLKTDLHMSSFSLMVLVYELEKYLKIEINPTFLNNADTVYELLSAINSYLDIHQ